MDIETFKALAAALTGTPVKELTKRDQAFLVQILQNDQREIDCSQLNELLLLVNKDRVDRPFFRKFFQPPCRVSTISSGVERFQKMALRRYGNFIYAYRRLSRLSTDAALEEELGECASQPADLIARYEGRSDKLIEIETIERKHTPLVGYLSAGEIVAENKRAVHLRNHLPAPGAQFGADWAAYEEGVIVAALVAGEHRPLRTIIANYRVANPVATLAQFAGYLEGIIPQLAERQQLLLTVRDRAIRNQDIYLTWDHMDVYFATSMRKRWEFEDLYDFVNDLMGIVDPIV